MLTYADIVREGNRRILQSSLAVKKPAVSVMPVKQKASSNLKRKKGRAQAKPEQPQVTTASSSTKMVKVTPETLQDSTTKQKTLHLSTEESLKKVVNLTHEKAMVRPNCPALNANTNNMAVEEKKTMPLTYAHIVREGKTLQNSMAAKKPAVSVMPVKQKASSNLKRKKGLTQAQPEQPQVTTASSSTKMVKVTPETLQDSTTKQKTLHLSTEESLKKVVNLTSEKAMVRPNCPGLNANTNNMAVEEKKTMPLTYAHIVREGKTLQNSMAAKKPAVSVMPVKQKASSNLKRKKGRAQAKPEQPQVTTASSSTKMVKVTPETLQDSTTKQKTLHLSTEESLKKVVNLTSEKAMVRPNCPGLNANTNNMAVEEKKTMPLTYAHIVHEGKTLQNSMAAKKPAVSVMPVKQKASSNLKRKKGRAQAKPEQPQVTTASSSTKMVKVTPETLQDSTTKQKTLHLSTEESLKKVVNLTSEKAMVRPNCPGLDANTNNMAVEEKKTMPLTYAHIVREGKTLQNSMAAEKSAVSVMPVKQKASPNLKRKKGLTQAQPEQPQVTTASSSTKMVKVTHETLQDSTTKQKTLHLSTEESLKKVVNLTHEKAMVRPNCPGLDANTNNMAVEEKKTMPLTYAHIVREGKTLQNSMAAKKPAVSVMPVKQKASSNLKRKKGRAQAKPEQPQVTTASSSTKMVKEAESDEQLNNKRLNFAAILLSELTPETLQDSITKLKTLNLSTEECLKELVNLTFEKAMVRPKCIGLYANICHCLSMVKVPSTADPTVVVSFQTLLGRLCQTEYNSIFGSNNLNEKRETTLSRSVSTIQFIAELYKRNLLSQAAMHSCIKGLLNMKDAESLECLCELLKVISQGLEVVTPMSVMNSYYNQMEAMAKDKMSPRISFMLESTIKSRQNSFLGLKNSEVPQAKDIASRSTASSKLAYRG
ncbi:uncharacterized protein [Paralichthys olivaceus]|uniref:uncharacterized protein n=1 Tax=Paralichthys olivaceus TaxID=8255 RepID=UPI0037524333